MVYPQRSQILEEAVLKSAAEVCTLLKPPPEEEEEN